VVKRPRWQYWAVSMIEAYVAELDHALRGPRRVKADMLAEARDGLLDATEAYRDSGLDEDGAQRRAIADFGRIPEVAPDFQAELGLSQGRRTAVLISLVLLVQPVVWRPVLHLIGNRDGAATPTFEMVNDLVQWTGIAAIGGGLLTVTALGIGTRYLGSRFLTRATGIFAFVVCGVFALLGLWLTMVSPATGSLLALSGLPSTMVLLGLPLGGVAVAARRCLAAA
jgi:hypothetical protein